MATSSVISTANSSRSSTDGLSPQQWFFLVITTMGFLGYLNNGIFIAARWLFFWRQVCWVTYHLPRRPMWQGSNFSLSSFFFSATQSVWWPTYYISRTVSLRVALTRAVARLWCYFWSQMWLSWGWSRWGRRRFGVEKSPLRLLLLTRDLKISVGIGVGTSH